MDVLQSIHVQLDEYFGKTTLLVSLNLVFDQIHTLTEFILSSTQQPEGLETRFSTVNLPPNPQDCIVVNAIVSERHDQLSDLASQIKQVESAIQKLAAIQAKLEANSEHVRRSLLAHQSLTSTARRIPPEVLGKIFYNCLPQESYIAPHHAKCPMVLTQVCRHWRSVAISTPRLWSSFSINFRRAARDNTRRGYEAWFAKAKSVPLSVRVLYDLTLAEADTALVVNWLRPLLHCSDFWWSGLAPPPGLFSAETSLHLERLHITTYRANPAITLPGPAQRLRYTYLQCLNRDLRSLGTITLPWAHLSELHMHFALVSSPVFLHLLTLCTSLHKIVVSCLCADEEQIALRAISQGSIVHHSLRRIEIKVIKAGLDLLFDALSLPALDELDISFCYRERDPWPHAEFLALLTRSRCPLKRLIIRSNKNALRYFAEYKQAFPSLSIITSTHESSIVY